jgi:hypothetical protein
MDRQCTDAAAAEAPTCCVTWLAATAADVVARERGNMMDSQEGVVCEKLQPTTTTISHSDNSSFRCGRNARPSQAGQAGQLVGSGKRRASSSRQYKIN